MKNHPTTQTGFENRNGQVNLGPLGMPGTDHNQQLYQMRCRQCGGEHAANGSDVFQRKCPKCQGGRASSGGWSPEPN